MTTDVVSPPLDTAPDSAVRVPRVSGTAWRPSRVAASWRRTPTTWVLAGALVAVAVRLPYLRAPLGSDEGGFLMVASQWRGGGTSLYGDYWVDRPPLLIGFFAAADHLGGATALRLMGCGLAFSVVVLAHLLGREVARHVSPVSPWPVLAAVAFVSMPLTGTQAVNGELIALPLVLLGLLAALRATQHPAPLASAAALDSCRVAGHGRSDGQAELPRRVRLRRRAPRRDRLGPTRRNIGTSAGPHGN